MNIDGWTGLVVRDFDRFDRLVWANRAKLIVIDEAAAVFQDRDTRQRAINIARRGRHQDHCVFLIALREPDIDKTARDQCTDRFHFRCDPIDAIDYGRRWGGGPIAEAHRLPPLHFVHIDTQGVQRCGRVTF